MVWTKGRLLFKEKATSGSSGTTAAAATGTASASGSGSSPGTTAGGGAGGVAVVEDSAEKFCTVIERDTLKVNGEGQGEGLSSLCNMNNEGADGLIDFCFTCTCMSHT